MPDWTYQTVFRPLLFGLGPRLGRRLALGAMGRLSRLPLGKRVIQLMGHMNPDSRLAVERNGMTFPAQVGLGCKLDPQLTATGALHEFGFGYLEIGPIAARGDPMVGAMQLDAVGESVLLASPRESITPVVACRRLERVGPLRMPVFARLEPSTSEEARRFLELLSSTVDGFVVPIDLWETVQQVWDEAVVERAELFVAIDAVGWGETSIRDRCLSAARENSIAGVIVEAPTKERGQRIGKPGFADAVAATRSIREALGAEPIVIGSVGVHCPADALDYLEAGADLVQVDTGLVFSGPGLPKRINEALLYRQLMKAPDPSPNPVTTRLASESWFWAFLMGLSMFGGGLLAMLVATTRVVLPYDEAMSGLTRDELAQINDRLLLFMTHDRVTLAGTMIAVGILYIALAWFGIRRGVHWAYMSVVVSAMTGFFCFFSFLGFGYFDPFHAFVTAILFQFLLLTMHSPMPVRQLSEAPALRNESSWKASQWGQLLFVIHGAVLIVAGLTIISVGMTTVFVAEDLEFMQTSATDLHGAHPHLVPLVAHDRATFGGLLIACGVVTLLPALWGFQRGQAWLWWALMLAGTIAYVSTMIVHWSVGYDSLMHLLPVYGGLAWLWAGGIASYHFLVGRDPSLDTEWQQRLARL